MKLSFLFILAFLWGNSAFSQTLSDLSGKTISDIYSSESPIIEKTKLIQNYNSKVKHTSYTSAKVQKQGLDSLFVMDVDTLSGIRMRYTFSYDGQGRQTSVIKSYQQSPSNPWQRSNKDEFVYNGSGNLVTDVLYNWNYVLNKWVEIRKWEFIYNTSGLITQTTISVWDNALHIWIKDQRQNSTYDASSNLIRINYELWNATTSQWEASGKKVFDYVSGKMVQWLSYIKNSQNQIVPHIKITYDFYPNDSIKSLVSQLYYPSNNIWLYLGKTEKFYDSNHDNILSLEYKYDYNNNRWDTIHKNEYLFFPNHHHSIDISFSKDTALSIWVTQSKTSFTEDSNSNVITNSRYFWNSINSVWDPSSKNEFFIDCSASYADLILPIEYEGSCIKAKLDYANQYRGYYYPNLWTYYRHYQYFFSLQTVGIEDNAKVKPEISISPNPSNGRFKITLSNKFKDVNIEIVNIAGKEIYRKKVQNISNFNIELNAPSGLYFIKVQEGSGYYEIHKIIITK